jgi:ribosomal protein S26
MLRRGVLPFVRRRSTFVVVVVIPLLPFDMFVSCAILMSMEKIKSDEEAKKKQRIGLREK